jgi:hypothetical protein
MPTTRSRSERGRSTDGSALRARLRRPVPHPPAAYESDAPPRARTPEVATGSRAAPRWRLFQPQHRRRRPHRWRVRADSSVNDTLLAVGAPDRARAVRYAIPRRFKHRGPERTAGPSRAAVTSARFSAPQLQAVTAADRPLAVVAGPGCENPPSSRPASLPARAFDPSAVMSKKWAASIRECRAGVSD